MPINKDLQDSAIRHQIFMSRVSTGVRNRMLALLNRSEADLVRTMNALDPDLVSTRFKAARIERMLRDIRDQQAQLKGEFKRALRAETGPIAVNEHNFTRKQLIEAAGKSFAKGFDFVSPARVQAAATARPFQSVHLKWATQGEHVDELFRRRMGLVRDEIRRGFVEGASTPELVRRIRGTRAQNFTDEDRGQSHSECGPPDHVRGERGPDRWYPICCDPGRAHDGGLCVCVYRDSAARITFEGLYQKV
jgi:hypothetical protein